MLLEVCYKSVCCISAWRVLLKCVISQYVVFQQGESVAEVRTPTGSTHTHNITAIYGAAVARSVDANMSYTVLSGSNLSKQVMVKTC